MFPMEIFLPYTLACVLLVMSPGPDNLLAIGRGLSQGPYGCSDLWLVIWCRHFISCGSSYFWLDCADADFGNCILDR